MAQRRRFSLKTFFLVVTICVVAIASYRAGYKHRQSQYSTRVYSLVGLLQLDPDHPPEPEELFYTVHDEWVRDLIETLVDSVSSDSWEYDEDGNEQCWIKPGPDYLTLVVRQSPDVHDELEAVLKDYAGVRESVLNARLEALGRRYSSDGPIFSGGGRR